MSTVNNLAANQSAWINQSDVHVCLAQDQLRIKRWLPVSLTENKEQGYFQIVRFDDGIALDLLPDKSEKTRSLYQSMAYQIASAINCGESAENYLPVIKVLGAQTQAELLSLAPNYLSLESDKVEVKPPADDIPVINWATSVETDDAGNPVSVTFSQSDEAQHTVLEVKCAALEVSLSITVSDYLGNNSQNALIKFGEEKFKPIRLGLTDNHRGLFFTDIAQWLPQLRGAQQMTLRYTNYNEMMQTLNYPLTELDSKLQSYPGLCGAE